MKRILVIGAAGQIGTDLVIELRNRYGVENVVASDIRPASDEVMQSGAFETLDVLNRIQLDQVVDTYGITQIYLLAAVLSGNAEKRPIWAWDLNMTSLFNVFECAREKKLDRIFWPSSIAVFGPSTPRKYTPQYTIIEPTTVYGISKLAGERWIEYYSTKYNMDIRSVRYPGLISYKAEAGGGTTDYAVEIFYEAIKSGTYECFLKEDTVLPMMFMPDAIRATIELMELNRSEMSVRSSYNIAAFSFCPRDLAYEIQKFLPSFIITYKPDFRQSIADSWPQSIDDSIARQNNGWKHEYNLSKMTEIMMREIKKKLE